METLLDKLGAENCDVFVAGDFNIDLLKRTGNTFNFETLMAYKSAIVNSLELTQEKIVMLRHENREDMYACQAENVNDKWQLFMNTLVPSFNECIPKKLVNSKRHYLNQHRNNPIVKFCKNQLDICYVLKEHISALEDLYRDNKRAYNSALESAKERLFINKINNSHIVQKSLEHSQQCK
ncbi:hypothetical protein HHI36_005969 [Cryptolaemus montrouzieri]|uniref:Endonuclease/exonuclease/phosphatase domain-containing protein n=1 Tax=Cryptolaemus montrouzieri TaxID=559131 RepID=A0ABD2NWM5_9CUCU